MQCCVDDPDVIFSWRGTGSPPLAADFVNLDNVFKTAGHAFDGDDAIHSDHSSSLGFYAELSKDFIPDPAIVIPEDQGYQPEACGGPRIEFAIGYIGNFINNFDPTNGYYFIEIRHSELANETIVSIYRAGRNIWVYKGASADLAVGVIRNAITPGTPVKIEIRGQINTYDLDQNSNEDGWIEFRVNGRVVQEGDDVEAIPVDEPPEPCPKGKDGISFRVDGPPTGETQASWNRVTFGPMGDISCLYIKEKAQYCNDVEKLEDPVIGGPAPDCVAPGPGGSSFDGQPQGPRFVAAGGFPFGPADYVAPTGGGISATASDPTDPQSLTDITTPLVSLDITLVDSTVRRCSQAGPLPQAGRAPATWQVQRFGPVEYARSDRFGHIRSQTWEVEIIDPDGEVRSDLNADGNRFYRRWQGQLFVEDDAQRLAGTARQPLARGRCVSANVSTPQVVTLTFSDELTYPNSPTSLERRLPPNAVEDVFRLGVTGAGLIATMDAPEHVLERPIQLLLGETSDERRVLGSDTPVGIVKLIYVGDFLLASGSERWHGYVVCQYACAAIKSLFGSNLHPQCPASVRLDPDLFSSEFLVPDLGNWASYFATPYIDLTLNGKTTRVTMIFGRGMRSQQHVDGLVPLSINVWGKEDVGDGSGDLITDAAQIIQALFHWPILQRARIGNEAMPTFTGGTAKFRTSSAVAVTAIHDARREDGYPGELIIDEFRSAGDWLASALSSWNLRLHTNHHGQLVLTTLNDATPLTGLPTFTDVQHVRGDSFRTTSERAGELENALTYDFGPEPATGRVTGSTRTTRDEESIDNWDAAGEPYKGDEQHLVGVYIGDLAGDIIARKILETKDGITRGEWATDLDVFAVKPGDLFRLTDFRGLGASGWTRRVLLADAIVLNPNVSNPPQEDDLGITVKWQDVQGLVAAPEGFEGGGETSDGETMSIYGYQPVGDASGGGWIIGDATGGGWRVA